MPYTVRISLWLVLSVVFQCSVALAQIRPLDDDRLREAVAPHTKMPMNVLLPPLENARDSVEQRIARRPFRVTFITPYYNAWTEASENRRKFLPPPTLSAQELNNRDVLVLVEPTRYAPAGTLETIVVKRGDVITRPLREARTLAGYGEAVGFLFRFSDFAEELGAYTLICITKSNNIEFFVSNDAIYDMK